MKIVVAGGTGLIGRRLVHQLISDGHRVTLLTRSTTHRPDSPSDSVRHATWNGRDVGPWMEVVAEADGVVNVTGASIGGGRWTKRRKALIRESRLQATGALVEAMLRRPGGPKVLVNASAVGYYGNVPDGDVEETHAPGTDFLAGVCRDWEEAARRATTGGVRVVTMRTGIVLERSGGALARLALPFRLFVGGPLGTGRQWLPWIHHADATSSIIRFLTDETTSGPYNLVSPNAVRMTDFCRTLGSALYRPSWAPVPSLALRLLLGEMAGIILTGQKAVPRRLIESGFQFQHAELAEALSDVLKEG